MKAAGFEPIPPAATGSEIIHANIIKQLAHADMVLCDISSLNPNVFYEFGIRTALNKPVAVVHDESVKKIPFDTGIINAFPYSSSMKAWEIEANKKGLVEHIAETSKRSKGQNPMWTYFGISQNAALPSGATSPEQMMEVILAKIESLEKTQQAAKIEVRANQPLLELSRLVAEPREPAKISDDLRLRIEELNRRLGFGQSLAASGEEKK